MSTAAYVYKLLAHTHLSPEEQSALLSVPGTFQAVSRGGFVVRKDEQIDTCCVVAEGVLASVVEGREGYRQIAAFHLAGEMPQPYVILTFRAEATLQAVCASKIFRISRDALRKIAHNHSGIAEAFGRETMAEARIMNQWLLNIGQRPARARVAHLICEFAQRLVAHPADRFSFLFDVGQTYLGQATGLSPVHVNRVLQKLKADRILIFRRHSVEVCDWEALCNLAGFDPAYLKLTPSQSSGLNLP